MKAPIATAVVEWSALGKVVLYSLLAGVGVSVVFGFAVRGPIRFAELRRDGRSLEAAAYAVVAAGGLVLTLALAGYGIYLTTRK